jgi:hypothetical protein
MWVEAPSLGESATTDPVALPTIPAPVDLGRLVLADTPSFTLPDSCWSSTYVHAWDDEGFGPVGYYHRDPATCVDIMEEPVVGPLHEVQDRLASDFVAQWNACSPDGDPLSGYDCDPTVHGISYGNFCVDYFGTGSPGYMRCDFQISTGGSFEYTWGICAISVRCRDTTDCPFPI